MDKPNNPLRRTTLIWAGIIVIGAIIVFIPGLIGMDGFNGGFALAGGGVFVGIFGIIGTIIYARLAGRLDQLLKKENQLAHWTYTPEEWRAYTERDYVEDKAGKKGLFILVSVIAVIVGVIFYAIVRNDFLVIFFTILGIIIMCGLAAYLSAASVHRHNRKHQGEAYISQDGVYLNRQAYIWKGMGSRLENAVYEEENIPQPRIKFVISAISNMGRNYYNVRVPVPDGQEQKAMQVIADIRAAHNKPPQSPAAGVKPG